MSGSIATMAGDSTGYLRRLVDAQLDRYQGQLPAMMLVGPRACGKTTTAARRARTVVRLDIPGRAAAFRADPDAALEGLDEPVFIDEWQLAPEVLGAVRRSVDAAPRAGRYLIAGSVRAAIEQELWPGTGRLTRLVMYPLTRREQLGRVDGPGLLGRLIAGEPVGAGDEELNVRDYVGLILAGGFPEPVLRLSGDARRAWLDSYVNDLLSRDVQALSGTRGRPRDPVRLRGYFDAYALNSAGVPDHATIYNAAKVNLKTANAYEGLLTDIFALEQIRAWASNRLKRLVATEKRYVVDPGLWAAALRVDAQAILDEDDLLGRALDTFAAAQLRPEVATLGASMYHLRTQGGRQEVDLLIELRDRRLIAIEVKAGSAPDASDARHLEWLRDAYSDRFLAGMVLHTGPAVYRLGEQMTAVPLSALWAA